MSVLLLKFAPYIAAVLVVFGAGTWTGYRLNPYQERYKDLVATQALDQADAEEAVRKTLTAQLAQAQATSSNNADALVRLANENAHITADRDANLALARRLLNGQTHRTCAGTGVPQAPDKSSAPAAGGPEGPTRAESLLVAAADESERCANQLNSLIAQIKPQL